MRRFVLLLGVLLLGVSSPRLSVGNPPWRPFVFEAPAGTRPIGAFNALKPFAQILPSGRIINPIGDSVVVGMNALGIALTPDGHYAIISNDDESQGDAVSALDSLTHGGYSLAVVDTRTMKVVDRYRNDEEAFFVGIVALADPNNPMNTLVLVGGGPSNEVYALDLDANGHLSMDAQHRIAIPAPIDDSFADVGHAFPATIALSRNGARAYVVNELAGTVSTIDTKTRTLLGISPSVGFFPYGAALAGGRLLVTNEGLMRYAKLPAPLQSPPFDNVMPDAQRASSLSFVPIATDGSLATSIVHLAMDSPPDGVTHVGGAHPTAVVTSPDQTYAFIAMANVDRIATVLLGPSPRVVGGTDLRLYARSPYGTQPNALVLSRDGKRLYVALAGINAIAVLDASDPRRLHRVGLLPTGWYPAALALSKDDRVLFVANAKGFNHDRGLHAAVGGAVWSTLQRIDLRGIDLRKTTRATLSYQHVAHVLLPNSILPQAFSTRGSAKIKHVVLILEEGKTYDAMLGDLTDVLGRSYGPGDPALVVGGQRLTPNLHALALSFSLAGNFYADAQESDAGQQFAFGGVAGVYTEKTHLLKAGRMPWIDGSDDPEVYPRAGYIFNSLALAKKTYRDYGSLLRLSGYDEGAASNDAFAPMASLGGTYALDVPALAALSGHVDTNYPGWNVRIHDVRRAAEFIRDFDVLVKSGHMPAFTSLWLPDDGGGMADGDRALGMIAEYLTHLPEWRQMAIFIMPENTRSTRDHIDENRTYALVVSPYAKRHYVSGRHLSTVSVLKTEEELLGLPALSLDDMLAGDMHDFFTGKVNFAPFVRSDLGESL